MEIILQMIALSRISRGCRWLLLLRVIMGLAFGAPTTVSARVNDRPFSLPFSTPPSPSTWLLGQQYGNTLGAYNFGPYWYGGGQGLHFGVDFAAPCGTDVVAIADGTVEYIDNFEFGLLPHNLVIVHSDLGYT